jgi:hypothetical protein
MGRTFRRKRSHLDRGDPASAGNDNRRRAEATQFVVLIRFEA